MHLGLIVMYRPSAGPDMAAEWFHAEDAGHR
jgi:hypothetical protein